MSTQPNPHGAVPASSVGWKNHNDAPLNDDAVFIGDPGASIGDVLSATTELKQNGSMVGGTGKLVGRILGALFFGACGAGAGYGVAIGVFRVLRGHGEVPEMLLYAGAGILGVLAFAASMLLIQPGPTTTYVGSEGLLRIKRKGRDANMDHVRFEDVTGLTTHQVRNYTNGVYTGTNYTFTFHRRQGGKPFVINGAFQTKEGTQAPAHNFVHFAWAAERAYTLFRLHGMDQQLAQQGMLHFDAGGGNRISLGTNVMELTFKGQTERLQKSDIASLNLNAGMLTIERVGATKGMFSKSGVFTFNVGQMHDFRYFLIALEMLLGYRFN